jgi:AraC family transcriptional regulator
MAVNQNRSPAMRDASTDVDAQATLPVSLPVAQCLVAAWIHGLSQVRRVRFGAASGVLAPWQLRLARTLLQANVSVDQVARQCGLSRGWFCQAFKRTTGQAPHRWLQQARVERAQALLLGDMPIVEVADRCGFADQSHLTRVFGRLVGMPPARWRALNK